MELFEVRDSLHVKKADITASSFFDVKLLKATFDDVNLFGARFNNANMAEVSFTDVNLTNASISAANLTGMRIDGILVSDLIQAYRRQTPDAGR